MKRGYKQFEEINKNFLKIENDLRLIKGNQEATDRNLAIYSDNTKS